MHIYRRAVRFEEVDAAGIVFFGYFANFVHEAMEAFFASIDGGYPRLITGRKVGLPAVHVEMSFKAPLRYGDSFRIETVAQRVGNRSAVLRYTLRNEDTKEAVAEVVHTVVTTDLTSMRSCDMPADLRAVLEEHQEASPR